MVNVSAEAAIGGARLGCLFVYLVVDLMVSTLFEKREILETVMTDQWNSCTAVTSRHSTGAARRMQSSRAEYA